MDEKPWYLSKTIWASLLIVIVSALSIFGRPEEAAAVQEESGGIADWIVQLITLILGALAFYGRITTKAKLTP
jgi:hypothetical protein